MKQQEKMKADLLMELDGYYMNLVYIKDLINVAEHIMNSDEIERFAPNFNLIVQCGLCDSYMLGLMKLYDKSEKAKTIPNLIQKCKRNVHLFNAPDEVREKLLAFEERLNKDEYITYAVKILRERRDSSHVHNDRKYFGEKIVNDASYLPQFCIWHLRDFSEEVLSYLWSQLTTELCRETKYNNDLEHLLKKL